MTRYDYIHEVDTLTAPASLRKKVATLAEREKDRPPRVAGATCRGGHHRLPRWSAIAAALVLVVGLGVAAPAIFKALFTGGELVAPPVATATPTPHAADPWGIRLSAEGVSATRLTLVLERAEDASIELLSTGPDFWIERYENGQWRALEPILPEDKIVWQQGGLGGLYAGGSAKESMDWNWLYGPLPDGAYRLGKTFSVPESQDSRDYYAEFTLGGAGDGQAVQGVAVDEIDYTELEARMDPGDWAALQEYLPVLREGTRFRWIAEEGVTGGGGEDVTLEEYYAQRFGPDLPDGMLDLERLTLFGFEGDGKQDLVLCFFNGGGHYLILHREGEDFYGFERGYRSFLELQQDGVYAGSGGAMYTSYHRIQFHAGYYEEELLGQRSGETYEIGGTAVSEEYFTRWREGLMVGDKAWYDFPPKIRNEISDVVLPMTMAPGSELPAGISVERDLTFDFNDPTERGYPMTDDQYTFRNNTLEDQTVALFYPFRGYLGMGQSFKGVSGGKSDLNGALVGVPTVTAEHGALTYGFDSSYLHAGAPLDTDGWDWLSFALAGSDYINASVTQDSYSLRDVPVHAYAVTDMEGYDKMTPDAERTKCPNLRVDLKLADPEHTQVFTYGFHIYYGKAQFGYLDRCDSCTTAGPKYIILVGGDLTGYTMSGWQHTTWAEPLSGLTAKLTPLEEVTGDGMDRYLGGLLYRCLTDYVATRDLPLVTSAPGVPTTELYNAVARYILSDCMGEPMLHALYGEELPAEASANLDSAYELSYGVESILYHVLTAPRVLYYEGAVTVPPGGFTIVHAAAYRRPSASGESGAESSGTVFGFDLSPALSTRIPVGRVSVTLHLGGMDVTDTNMGDHEQAWSLYPDRWRYGALDPTAKRYFFDVQESS